MTEENQRRNALDELLRADTCLAEARALHGAALPYGAASRACYAVFHAARALLFSLYSVAPSFRSSSTVPFVRFFRPLYSLNVASPDPFAGARGASVSARGVCP